MGAFGFFTTAELRARGETVVSIRRSIESGTRFRVIKRWYGGPDSPQQAVLAMRIGGRLGCLSALSLYGAWVPPDTGVHVVFPTAASGRRSAGREKGPSVVRHWSAPGERTGSAFAVAPLDVAITDALKCAPPHLLIAVLDSLLNIGAITRNRLEVLIRRGPKRVHHLAAHLEPRSGSGIESILRYLLAIAGVNVDVQVVMRSRDRVDLSIGGWLVLEADGREWHSQREAFTRDRERVVRLMREGQIVLQFAFATIMYDYETVLAAVQDVIARHAPIA